MIRFNEQRLAPTVAWTDQETIAAGANGWTETRYAIAENGEQIEIESWNPLMEKDRWFFWLLTLVFITLKLTGTIDWSWWFVLSPIWGPFLFFVGMVLVLWLISKNAERKLKRKMEDRRSERNGR